MTEKLEAFLKARSKPAKRKSYHHGDLRQALIDASLQLIATEGEGTLSLRSVARLAGVSHAAPYAHFEDKEDLIEAVKEEGFRELRDRIAAGLAELPPEPLARLREAGKLYFRFAFEQPAKYELMMRRPLRRDPKPSTTYVETGRSLFELLAGEVGRLYAAKPPKAGTPPELAAMASWAALHGLCSLWMGGPMGLIAPPGTELDELADRFLDYLLSAMASV